MRQRPVRHRGDHERGIAKRHHHLAALAIGAVAPQRGGFQPLILRKRGHTALLLVCCLAIDYPKAETRSTIPGKSLKRSDFPGQSGAVRTSGSCPSRSWAAPGTGHMFRRLEPGQLRAGKGDDLLRAGSAPGFSSTKAQGTSPHFSSGLATTAQSSTASWAIRQLSTSTELTFSPPEMMMSLARSLIST